MRFDERLLIKGGYRDIAGSNGLKELLQMASLLPLLTAPMTR